MVLLAFETEIAAPPAKVREVVRDETVRGSPMPFLTNDAVSRLGEVSRMEPKPYQEY
jgi:hypothetical protein